MPRLGGLHKARGLRQVREALRPVADGAGGSLSALYYLPRHQVLIQAHFVQLSPEGRELSTVFAEQATYDEERGAWRFVGGFRSEARAAASALGSAASAQITALPPAGEWVHTRIRRSDVEASIVSPAYLSAEQLREQLARTPGLKQLEIQIYERYTQPLAGLALLLVALPIVFGVAEGGNLYLRALSCLGLGVVYFFGATICRELGAREFLPPLVAIGFSRV